MAEVAITGDDLIQTKAEIYVPIGKRDNRSVVDSGPMALTTDSSFTIRP
jgi:hypothetical protein